MGRRGSALQSDTKVGSVAYEEASVSMTESFEKRQQGLSNRAGNDQR